MCFVYGGAAAAAVGGGGRVCVACSAAFLSRHKKQQLQQTKNEQTTNTKIKILSFHVVPDRALGAAALQDGDVLDTYLPGAQLQVHAEPLSFFDFCLFALCVLLRPLPARAQRLAAAAAQRARLPLTSTNTNTKTSARWACRS